MLLYTPASFIVLQSAKKWMEKKAGLQCFFYLSCFFGSILSPTIDSPLSAPDSPHCLLDFAGMSETDSLTAHSDMNDFTLKSQNSFQHFSMECCSRCQERCWRQ